jgi:hypothetical protein
MIIKFFGRVKNVEEGGDKDSEAKIEFMTVIEVLT